MIAGSFQEAADPSERLIGMTRGPITRLLHETVHFLLGLIALAALTALCFWLDFQLVSTAFIYLILIVVLSLAVAFIPLVALSFIAVGCLNYFFAPPIFSFRIEYQEDIVTVAAFLITSLTVTSLVRRTRAAKDALANVVDGIPALIWNTSPDGSADFSNQRFRDYTGFSSEDVRGWGWMNALHPEDRKVEEWRAAFAAGEPFENEVRIRSANGDYRWFVLRMTPLRNEQGTIVKWYGTASDVEERRRAVEALRDSEQRWQAVFEHNPTMYFIVDDAGTVLSVNPFGAEQLGYSVDELVGRSVLNVFQETDRAAIQRNAASCLERLGQSMSWEARKVRKDGTVLWVRETGKAMLMKERPVILIVCENITERKRLENHLAEAQRISHTGSFAYDVAGRRLIYSSEEHHRLFGFDPAARMPAPKDWARRIHPDDREKAVHTMEQRLRERTDYEVDFRIVLPDGTLKYIHSISHAVSSPAGDLVEIVGTSTDVTDRRRAEYLTQQVFERSPDLVGILGRDYRYRRANPMYETFWGIAPEKVVGMHIRDVIGEERFDRFAKPNLDRCSSGEEASYEGWFNGPGGRKYWFVTYSPLRLESERVEAVLIIARDLTERMLASEKLRDARMQLAHANRVATVGELTASIAHEVNQPIGALVTNAHAALRLLSARPPDLDQTRDALGDIIKDGRRVSEVIDRIRALVKKEPPQANPVDVNEAIVDSIALTRAEILRSGVSLETQLMKDLPPILGDRVQFQQVVMNLVMNAIEAMSAVDEATRELQIVTGQEGEDQIFVTVRDSGPTLKPESLDLFFEAFYSTKSHGMGIGLSICRSIIEAHEGRIWATANVPRGATLHITLPAAQKAASQ